MREVETSCSRCDVINDLKSYFICVFVCKAEETSSMKGFEKSVAFTVSTLTLQLQNSSQVFSIAQKWMRDLF